MFTILIHVHVFLLSSDPKPVRLSVKRYMLEPGQQWRFQLLELKY